jgi:hypothetical protein
VADNTLDNLWGALRDLLAAWGRLGAEAQAERARAALTRIFPDGLSFLNKPYKAEWADSETRLTLMDREGLVLQRYLLAGALSGPCFWLVAVGLKRKVSRHSRGSAVVLRERRSENAPPTQVGGSQFQLFREETARFGGQSPALVGAWLPRRSTVHGGSPPPPRGGL